MNDLSKYEMIIKDLSLIEAQAEVLVNKSKDINIRNAQLERTIEQLKAEKEALVQKITKLESEIDRLIGKTELTIFNQLNSKEKDALKAQIEKLINKIDFHISS